jgi:hypothetical protein
MRQSASCKQSAFCSKKLPNYRQSSAMLIFTFIGWDKRSRNGRFNLHDRRRRWWWMDFRLTKALNGEQSCLTPIYWAVRSRGHQGTSRIDSKMRWTKGAVGRTRERGSFYSSESGPDAMEGRSAAYEDLATPLSASNDSIFNYGWLYYWSPSSGYTRLGTLSKKIQSPSDHGRHEQCNFRLANY